ncbi:MAG: NAD(P)/FAD-dependent oxidoreductase, partial [Pseudomonadales bacterium]|nr:NAD(P)/FAD-dependent oxidoreductase [Pseudomonadales bacterium]
MPRFDSIVVGAGHNGLVCASYLRRAGQRVLVVERGSSPGGLAAGIEFAEGYRSAVAHSVSHFSERVAKDLELARFGFDARAASVPLVALDEDGAHISIEDGRLAGASEADSAAFEEFHRLMNRYASTMAPFWEKTVPRLSDRSPSEVAKFAHLGVSLRLLGKQDMLEFFRIATLSARDLVDEYFEEDRLKAALCWDGLIGGRMAPRSPNSAVLAMLYRGSTGFYGQHRIGPGGVRSLVDALVDASREAGVELLCDSPVRQVVLSATQQACGVELASGEVIEADRVISGVDPKHTFRDLVGYARLDIGFSNRIERLRSEGLVAKVHLALNGLPEFAGLTQPRGRLLMAPGLDAIEFAYDDAKYGEASKQPVLEVTLPSLEDASLAPEGHHVLSAHVMYVPARHREGWTNGARDALLESVMATIER